MKIAMVAQHATPMRPDGAGIAELAETLARQGHEVTVYARKPHPGMPDIAELGHGVRVEHITAGPAGQSDDDELLAQLPAFSGPLHDRLARQRPDVVHAIRWTSGLAALAAVRGLGIPVVQAFSSLGAGESRDHALAGPAASAPRARLKLEPVIGRSADAVVAASSAVVSDLTRLGVPRKSVRCVPCGVDTDLFTPEGPIADRNGRPRLLAAADLRERESLQTLLRALTKVPDAELMVVGGPVLGRLPKDPAYRALASMTGSLGLSDRVIFTGGVDRKSMPELLRSADLVLSTCAYDPSGATSLEAMACGKPVVAPAADGHTDAVVDGTTGILIPPGRPALLAQRIRRLLAHPMLIEAYGAAAADRVQSRYSWDRIATETLAVYDQTQLAAA
jgi:glycosyltransferase involved in cell wall biosynthesis